MAEKAKKLNSFMNMMGIKPAEGAQAPAPRAQPKAAAPAGYADNEGSREKKIIDAAIPFLDKDYQKGIYIAMRLLDIKKAFNETELFAQSSDSQENGDSRRKMLLSIKPYLKENERAEVDILLKAMEMRNLILLTKKGGFSL